MSDNFVGLLIIWIDVTIMTYFKANTFSCATKTNAFYSLNEHEIVLKKRRMKTKSIEANCRAALLSPVAVVTAWQKSLNMAAVTPLLPDI